MSFSSPNKEPIYRLIKHDFQKGGRGRNLRIHSHRDTPVSTY